jgi:hypothetical protein
VRFSDQQKEEQEIFNLTTNRYQSFRTLSKIKQMNSTQMLESEFKYTLSESRK